MAQSNYDTIRYIFALKLEINPVPHTLLFRMRNYLTDLTYNISIIISGCRNQPLVRFGINTRLLNSNLGNVHFGKRHLKILDYSDSVVS